MDWVTQFDKWITDYLPDVKLLKEEPMSKHTSFRVGGLAKRMAFPQKGEQMVLLLSLAEDCGARPLVIGKGTNLLASDSGLDRLVIETSGLSRLEVGETPGSILAETGVSLTRLADFACKQELTGLEFAHGIPGTVGGGICMNAGAYGGEMKQVVSGVSVLFPEEGVKFLTGEELAFGYRRSLFAERQSAVVLYAVFQLAPGNPEAIRETMRDMMARRKLSQPLDLPSAGSTFKRPEGQFAGTLIDRCGLKGRMVGGAQVSEKHAGFIVNRGGATCADIKELIRQVQEAVLKQTGIYLEPEVKFVD